MNRRNQRLHRRQFSGPLRATFGDRLGLDALSLPCSSSPTPKPMPLMPSPPKSARDVLALLAVATGFVLAAQPDAKVELLPGSPTTVLITNGGKAQAAFVLPVPHEEACRALGRPITPGPDPEFDLLWYEEQVAREAGHAG